MEVMVLGRFESYTRVQVFSVFVGVISERETTHDCQEIIAEKAMQLTCNLSKNLKSRSVVSCLLLFFSSVQL